MREYKFRAFYKQENKMYACEELALVSPHTPFLKIKKGKIERSKNNIFLDELKRIREIESTFNKNKTLIKKILCGEKEVTEADKLNEIYKTILTISITFNIIFTTRWFRLWIYF